MSEETKRCPFCGEEILSIAIKCKHCGEFLNKGEASELKEVNICPRCSKVFDDLWTVCLNCSVPLVKKQMDIKKLNARYMENLETKKDKNKLEFTCPRCGYEGEKKEFKDAYSDSTCCCLAFIMILPAIFYYFFRTGKKVCPKCKCMF